MPTVREHDGIALSSRNVYLDADDRAACARAVPRAVRRRGAAAAGGALARRSPRPPPSSAREPGVAVDYLELRGPDLGEIPEYGAARLLVAARVGSTRLIDNVAVTL